MDAHTLTQPASHIPVPEDKSKIRLIILGLIILVAIFAALAFWAFQTFQNRIFTPQSAPPNPNNIFSSQTAMIEGQVTQNNNGLLRIKNNQGVEAEFQSMDYVNVMDPLSINTPTPGETPTKPPLKFNTQASIHLQFIDNQYQVASITYLPNTQVIGDQEGGTPPVNDNPDPLPVPSLIPPIGFSSTSSASPR